MKKLFAGIIAVIMILSLGACGKQSDYRFAHEDMATGEYTYNSANDAVSKDVSYMSADYENAAYCETAAKEPVGFSGSGNNSESSTQDISTALQIQTEKIIYSADVTIETTDFENVISRLNAYIAEKGGFVESSSINDSSYYNKSRGYASQRNAEYVIRIPSQYFAETMQSMTNFGNVPYSYTYTENITAQYYDTQSRLDALKTQEKRLIELLGVAETVEDIVILEDRISEVRYSIDSLQSCMNNYDRKVAYSTIRLSLNEVKEYTPSVPVSRSFWQNLGDSIVYGFESALEFIQNFVLMLAENLPVLLINLAIIFAAVIILKKIMKKPFAKIKAGIAAKKNKAEK